MALTSLESTLASDKPSLRSLESAIGPVELAQWGTEIFRELGTTRCNQALKALRNMGFPTAKYRSLAATFKKGISEVKELTPRLLALWAPIFRKYNIHITMGRGSLVRIAGSLETNEISTPLELAT